jgi:glycosyltransferase involved in cell wall biosynthesis
MGAYANWFWGLRIGGSEPASVAAAPQVRRRRARIVPEKTVLIADFEPTIATLANYFKSPPRVMVLPALPETAIEGVSYYCYRTATNPIQWDEGVDATICRGIDTVAFLLPARDLRGQSLLRLRRLGIRRVLLLDRDGLRGVSPLRLALAKKVKTWGSQVLRNLGIGPNVTMTEEQCRAALSHARPRRVIPSYQHPLRIAHFVTALNSGGAERQACYAAIGQQRAGHNARLLTRLALVGADAHYLPLLGEHGVSARFIGSRWDDQFLDAWRRRGPSAEAFRAMPHELAAMVLDLLGEMLAHPVDVLHCYVDDCNIVGAIAGCLAGTPAIILSFRNGNPTHFPGLFRAWMLPWYKTVIGRAGVRLCANAEMGSRDYEAWLGLAERSIPIIRNAFTPPTVPNAEAAQSWRRQLGVPTDAPLVAGVFRLQPEKRPLYFVECVSRLRKLVPRLRVVLAGVGELETEVRRKLHEAQLESVVSLLGQRHDVPLILAASDALLLVSDWEGTPNILLEAQHCGCVPVATDAGGSQEAMSPGETGLLAGLDDLDGTVHALANLLHDRERRRKMAAAGPGFVASHFAPVALHEANMHLYREALADS